MEEQDWRTSITHKLTQPSSAVVVRELKDFALVSDEFYFWGNDGVLAQGIAKDEAKEEL